MHFLALLLAVPLAALSALAWTTAGPEEPVEFQLPNRGAKMAAARYLGVAAFMCVAHFIREEFMRPRPDPTVAESTSTAAE